MTVRDLLETPRTRRARLVDLLTGRTTRDAQLVAAVAAQVAAGALASINGASFGFFANAEGDPSCSITATDKTLTSPNNPWSAGDVGKAIHVAGAGAAGGTLSTRIASFTGAGEVELVDAAATTVAASKTSAGGLAVWGDDWTEEESAEGEDTDGDRRNRSLFSVLPEGASVVRSLADRFADVVNAKDYGATGDGATDDAAAINRAVDVLVSRGGGMLLFPEGTYIIGTPIKLRSNVAYVGLGWSSIIKQKAGVTAVNLFGEATPVAAQSNIIIRDLAIDGNRANCDFPADDADGNAIRCNQVSHSRFLNLYIHDTVFNAISLYNASNDNLVENNRIEDVGKVGVPPGAYTHCAVFMEFGANRNAIVHNRVQTTRQYGIWIGARDADNYDNRIEGNFVAGALSDGIRIGDDVTTNKAYRPSVIGNRVLSNGDLGIRIFHAGGADQVIDAIVIGNTVEANTNGGIYAVAGSLRALISGNICRSNGNYGISGAGVDTMISGNISLNNTTGGVQVAGTRTVDQFNTIAALGYPYSSQEIRSGAKLTASVGSGSNADLVLDQSGVVAWTLRNLATSGVLEALFGGTAALQVQRAPAAGDVGLMVYRNNGGTLSLVQVSADAADSSSAGFRRLRIPN